MSEQNVQYVWVGQFKVEWQQDTLIKQSDDRDVRQGGRSGLTEVEKQDKLRLVHRASDLHIDLYANCLQMNCFQCKFATAANVDWFQRHRIKRTGIP